MAEKQQRRWKTARQVSCGGVLYKLEDSKIYVILVARDGKRIWCLPKGLIEAGERPEETAVREVKEETGLEGKIIEKLDQIEYWYYWKPEQRRYHKIVHFYLLEFQCGNIADHDYELEAVEWFEIDEAIKLLSYKSERAVMEKAKQLLLSLLGGQKY